MESTQKYRCHHQRHHKSRGAAGAEGGLQLPRPAPIRCTVAARTRGCRPRPSWPRCPRRLRREPTNEGPASVASEQANVSKPKPYAWKPKSVKSTGPRSSAVGSGPRGRTHRWGHAAEGGGVSSCGERGLMIFLGVIQGSERRARGISVLSICRIGVTARAASSHAIRGSSRVFQTSSGYPPPRSAVSVTQRCKAGHAREERHLKPQF